MPSYFFAKTPRETLVSISKNDTETPVFAEDKKKMK